MNFDTNFNFALDIDAAMKTADPVPVESCKACQRSGLPILPLRAAYAPEPWHSQAIPVGRNPEVKAVRMRLEQPRILRQGFLYVLLDRKEWQAYQITPEGALRHFRPYQIPREEPKPLSRVCVMQDHDIPASFINIDTEKYSTAWLAIANDPWPERVLDDYLRGGVVDGLNLDDRFYKLDLKTARNDPGSVGIAMTETDLQMHQVLEYAQSMAGDFHSLHGFYPRNHRLRALAAHVGTVTQQHKLPNGVLALVLPDPIGVVQELDAQRLARFQAMQEWRAEPQRNFQFYTSQALLGIRQLKVQRAQALAIKEAEEAVEDRREYNARTQSYRAPLPPLDLEKEKQRRIAEEQADAGERLDDRYDEAARGAFEASYQKTLAIWQKTIDEVAEPYVSHYQGAAFELATRHDYSITSMRSVEAYIIMIQACLAGGTTDKVEEGRLGATQRLWKKLLNDHNSHFYKALLARDKRLLELLGDDLNGDERTRVYHTIKTIITSSEGKELMVAPVQAAIGGLLAAGATASSALGSELSDHTRALVGHLHREALLRFYGRQVTQLTITLKVGEYLTLLNEVLHEGTERLIGQLDQQFLKPAERKVRAMLLNSHFAPALASSYAALIEIKVWTLESSEALHARLQQLQAGVGDGIGDALRYVRVGATALTDGMKDLAHHLSVNAEAARLLARDSMQSIRSAASAGRPGAANMSLGLISLYFQQDALFRSYENMQKATSDRQSEASAAVMSASFGVMGATVESVGGAIHMLRPALTIPVAGQVQPVGLGMRIAQYGGALVAVASVMEGMQYAFAAVRADGVGDRKATIAYGGAAGLSGFAAITGVIGAMGGAGLLGPLGIAVILGLAAYGVAMWAKGLESQPLELWARHSYWGLPEKHRRWMTAQDLDIAIGALNAALLGLVADVEVIHRIQRPGDKVSGPGGTLDYRALLPRFGVEESHYEWVLRAYQLSGEGKVIAEGRAGDESKPPSNAVWTGRGSDPNGTSPVIHHDAKSGTLEISGSIAFNGFLDFHAVELEISYWPNKSDEQGVARLILKEDKLLRRAEDEVL